MRIHNIGIDTTTRKLKNNWVNTLYVCLYASSWGFAGKTTIGQKKLGQSIKVLATFKLVLHATVSLCFLYTLCRAWKHDYKHSRRHNNKHPFSTPGRPASTRSASEQTLDTPWSNNPIGHKHINHYADATCYSPIDWTPGRPGSTSLSGRGLGGAVDLRQTQANKTTHAEALSRSLSRERCAASISAAVSGGRHPSGGACMAHTIEREPLQTGIPWRRLGFTPRLVGSGISSNDASMTSWQVAEITAVRRVNL